MKEERRKGPGQPPSEARHEDHGSALRELPAVGAVIARADVAAIAERHGTALVTRAVRELVAEARAAILAGTTAPTVDARAISERVGALGRGTLVGVLNATGVVVHTNLGRVPLAAEAIDAMRAVATGYVTLEYDLDEGRRGHRHVHVRDLLVTLTGAEDAVVVNNNAAAMMLALGAMATGRSAIVSRGELVEIGGGFRIPDVVRQSGATLVEVGTTNRTHLADYEAAIDERTAVLLKVHRSNFEIRGFVAEVPVTALVTLGRTRGLTVIDDAGSGCMPEIAAIAGEPSVRERVASGADLVCFSGDKLLGGPQAGIVVGRREAIERLRASPLYRALRPDKLTLAALGATLALWRDRPHALPIVRMLRLDPQTLERRAAALRDRIDAHGVSASIVDALGRIGGGASPSITLPSRALRIAGPAPDALARALRHGEPSVVARIEDGAVIVDLRAVPEEDDVALAGAIRAALAS